ncbi:cytochrome c oxidase accessory protein CcoG [Marinospirillum alkaliphilum]|uniref:Cytochrome c oxidase accessory protein FixG n=1 Tax=Marinospirillum alkaliphilum DSM 21637 TaxID=1122209 RepID=A0A1K1VFP1_9GAMM|nr:cytochrome c oxidase accessory protein CcoG [Marinospirillum alkaliphilum]SFX23985.1 cytochrome c oxidase accessory protein FixG [Marinospirillum alkaliphilum DSM 21637]
MTEKIPTKDVTPVDAGQHRKSPTTGGPQGELYAKRRHIYVKRVQGLFQKLRTGSNWVLMLAFFFGSFIPWGGRQAIFFDLPNRQFHIFSVTFFPHDFMLLAWLLIILAFVLFFVTNFAGRVWCGYTCPQFVWTWLYIWVEDKTEGSPNQRKKLDKQPLNTEKALRKGAKHFIWVLIALATAIAFLGYFSPILDLIPRILSFDLGPWELFWLGFFTFFTYLFAGWMREQVCIYMCPYARFQAVMFDKDTLIVSYDTARGEPRGARKKSDDPAAKGLGSCIDCDLCVQVCPVGIDIRNGLQYECVTCAACIDACDQVMDKMGYPRGLIRYTTEEELAGRTTKILRPRLIGYFIVLLAMLVAFSVALSNRIPVELEVLRDRNQLLRMTSDGMVENSYLIRIANMDQREHSYTLTLHGVDGVELQGAAVYTLAGGEVRQFPIQVIGNPAQLPGSPAVNIEIRLQSQQDPRIAASRESRFFIRSAR